MSARRLIPLVVALAVAFAPAAVEACQASCLSHAVEMTSVKSEDHHHSHSAPMPMPAMAHDHVHQPATGTHAPRPEAVIDGYSHPCDHGDDVVALSAAVSDILLAPAVVAWTFHFPDMQARPLRVRDTAGQPSSEQIVLIAQLRV